MLSKKYSQSVLTGPVVSEKMGQVENAEAETEVRKRKYGNGNTEVGRTAACWWPG